MRVAIVHPWFLELGGSEKVVEVLAEAYPDADIFTLATDPACLPLHLRDKKIYTSVLNRLLVPPLHLKRYPFMLLYPWAVEGLDVSKYDLILSSFGPAMMGVSANQNAVHIGYCHSPDSAWWHLYAKHQAQMGWLKRKTFVACATVIRAWEFCAMQRVDYVIVNSRYIANRVSKYFRRQSTVIYPPVNTSMGYLSPQHDDYYLSLSRLGKEKRIDLAILACNRLKRRLLVVGSGQEEKRLKAIAGPTIEFLGRVPDEDIPKLYANCRAFLFAADEDFGIAPVEVQAFGRPVIAYGYGGSLETVRVNDPDGRSDTGVFFPEQTVGSVMDGIQRFEARESRFIPEDIQAHARQFDTAVFIDRMRQFVDDAMRKE
jgi:glycosyltransferase involved in cell wall biosynthesis